ncbi:hypothetical protein FA048_04385 [Pedobacter polaris]|uniref:Cardiolipin synthase N-terminal domain-containing protein n=1 Tax=Pedobacter polaris TaxID=2571273 RepID=A0A4U1CX15_9SPHI|nr:PLDc N-terminal domain-containing protein [Pedobacter polaris]TKC12860.1 hypothetical protein FA048_04385 [Pedobacter polaris]
MLLDFLNIGVGVILAIVAIPILLIVYCIVDILRSEFKTGLMKFVFLALVLFAPFLGSIIYLVIRKDYLKPKNSTNLPVV